MHRSTRGRTPVTTSPAGPTTVTSMASNEMTTSREALTGPAE